MNRKINALFLIAAAIVFLGTGCQKKDLASGNTIKIFYAAIEDGDYYEGWAGKIIWNGIGGRICSKFC